MSESMFDVLHPEVQLLIVIKLQMLQRETLPTLTYQNLEDYLSKMRWLRKTPTTLHEVANDILAITSHEVIRYLSHQAIVEGSREKLEDFQDLFGGVI